MELSAVKKEILGGLGRKHVTKSQELSDIQYITISIMLDDGCFSPSDEL